MAVRKVGSGARGYVLVALTLALVFLLSICGLAVDIGRMYITKSEAQSFVDSAALADPPLVTDYLELADPATFAPACEDYTGDALLLVAAKVGGTRLIDNMALTIGGST